jgi:glycosyltransferase involved in cell wall biosynthesis
VRVLFLTYEIPTPLDSGDRIYTANLLRQLVTRGAYVHLLAFRKRPGAGNERVDDPLQASGMPVASRVTLVDFRPKAKVRALLSPFPGMVANRRSAAFVGAVRRVVATDGPFDVIIVNHFKMAYIGTALERAAPGVATVLITHNAEAPLSETVYRNHVGPLRKAAYYVDFVKTSRCEPRYLRTYDVVTAICEPDGEYFSRRCGLSNVTILAPGIEVSLYPAQFPNPVRDRGIILCGSFLWEPKKLNLLGLLNSKSFGLLRAEGIKLFVVGQADPALVESVNRRHQNVLMTGAVPDVREYYQSCSIALVPEVMGGGFKLKVLEAAALKRAIVGVRNAVAAPGFVPGVHYFEARDVEELVTTTVALMKSEEKLTRVAAEAHELIRTRYSWQQAGDSLMMSIGKAMAIRRRV